MYYIQSLGFSSLFFSDGSVKWASIFVIYFLELIFNSLVTANISSVKNDCSFTRNSTSIASALKIYSFKININVATKQITPIIERRSQPL